MNSQGVPEPSADLLSLATAVRRAAVVLGQSSNQQRQQALMAMAASLEAHADRIGGDDVIDLAILEQFDLAVARLRAQRAHHHRPGSEGIVKALEVPQRAGGDVTS